ncbi:MAG: hypothetical protein J1E34_02555 [Oscillospiraceae bacterium]|nr:hypothetical protein [Oscillospiraceae bacterium]
MLCQNCHNKDADVHLRRIINGESAEMHLCADCARALGYGAVFSGFSFPTAKTLGDIFSGSELTSIGNRVLRCEICSLSFDDIVRSSRPGCPNCYRVFADKLMPYIREIHGRSMYKPGEETAVFDAGAGEEKWYREKKNHSDIVIGSTAVITAGVDGVPFPARLTPSQKSSLAVNILSLLKNVGDELSVCDPGRLYPYEMVSFAERALITPEFASAREGAVMAFSKDERVCVMLCDEDHIKIRTCVGGLSPEGAFSKAKKYRDAVNAGIPLAFSPRLGYLNQSPSRLGTALRASVIMHLPVLSKTGEIPALSSMISKLGLSVTGVDGSSLNASADMFRISNTLTMGISASQVLANLKAFCLQLETKERAAAEEYVKDISVRDRINRAASLLSGAVLLTSSEMNEMLSWIRLGSVYGLCPFDISDINELFFTLQSASVNTIAGAKLNRSERDELRARLVRKKLFSE